MPTNKAPCSFHLHDGDFYKMKYIAEKETRTFSNLMERLCKLYIEQYEDEHGEIDVDKWRSENES